MPFVRWISAWPVAALALLGGLTVGCSTHGPGTVENPRVVNAIAGVGVLRVDGVRVVVERGEGPNDLLTAFGARDDRPATGPLRIATGDGFWHSPFTVLSDERTSYELVAIRDDMTVWKTHTIVTGAQLFPPLPPVRQHQYDVIAVRPYNRRFVETLAWIVWWGERLRESSGGQQ